MRAVYADMRVLGAAEEYIAEQRKPKGARRPLPAICLGHKVEGRMGEVLDEVARRMRCGDVGRQRMGHG